MDSGVLGMFTGVFIGMLVGTLLGVALASDSSYSGKSLCEKQFKGEYIVDKCYKKVAREEIKL